MALRLIPTPMDAGAMDAGAMPTRAACEPAPIARGSSSPLGSACGGGRATAEHADPDGRSDHSGESSVRWAAVRDSMPPVRLGMAPSAEVLATETRALLAALAELHTRLKSLSELASAKLDAMRAADVATLDQLATREAAEIEALQEHDAERQAILARIAQQLPDSAGAALKLGELAPKLPEPFSSQIRAKNEGLRAAARGLEEKNRLVASVARGLHTHVRGMFADLASANQETVVYGRTGRHDQRVAHSWVDAVG